MQELTIEAFPSVAAATERREIFEQEASAHGDDTSTTVELSTDGAGRVRVGVSASAVARGWVVRLHLRPGERLVLSDAALAAAGGVGCVQHLEPRSCAEDHFPFLGAGTPPACEAGAVAEFRLEHSAEARYVEAALDFVAK